jgi:hypothetical protein
LANQISRAQIDDGIARILGLEGKNVEHLRKIVQIMAERRVARTLEAKPEAVKGRGRATNKTAKKVGKGTL